MLRQLVATRRSVMTSFGFGLAGVVLSILVIGLPGALVLAGTWTLAAGMGRLVIGLRGAVSSAAAIVIEVSLLVALSGVLARVAPGMHGPIANTVILAAPLVIGLAILAFALRRGSARRRDPAHSRPGISLTVLISVLTVTAWVSSRGPGYGVAWAMSGDARNHVMAIRGILSAGGLTLQELRGYPAVVDAVAALIAGAGDRAGLAPGQLVLHDAGAMATTYVLSVIGVAVLLVAALLETLPPAIGMARRLPVGVVAVLLACAAASASPLLLGTALAGGFLSAYGSLPVALAALVLALRCCTAPSPAAYALLGPAIVLTIFGWTVLAVVPVTAAAVVTVVLLLSWLPTRRQGQRATRRQAAVWGVAAAPPVAALALSVGIVATQQGPLRAALVLSGTMPAPEPHILLFLGLVTVGTFAAIRTSSERLQLFIPLCVLVTAWVTVQILRALPDGPLVPTYYSLKTSWLVASCLVWVAFVPLLRLAAAPALASPRRGWPAMARAVQAASLSIALLVVLGFTTPAPEPARQAGDGWHQPTAPSVMEAAKIGNKGKPFVLWEWADPGNDRLANFWAAAVWGSNAAGEWIPPDIAGWAYLEAGQIGDLCHIAEAAPGLSVITRSRDLDSQLDEACSGHGARVIVDGERRSPVG